ncbi:hypothetical protein O9X98_09005 [Agrobacterium salinitolerans]|nr:hypothetical protein [Agrobacterium salinitolerans]
MQGIREAITYIEQPILFAASKGMSFVYRRFGISPVRQVPGWEMAVSLIELVAVSIVFTLLYRAGERSLVYILPFLTVSMSLDAFTNHRKLKRLSNAYDAKTYRQAMTDAESNRVGSLFLRGFSLVIPVSSLIVFTAILPSSHVWIAWVATLYYSLYSSKFFVRACEPPRPDEGDFFAMPQAGRA